MIRFIKAWKFYRNAPISSFYLEMRVAKYASLEEYIDYPIDISRILRKLWNNQLADLTDPVGVSGYIPACFSETKKKDALSKLETALKRAELARECEKKGNIEDAFYWWNLVFAEKFPSYYYS